MAVALFQQPHEQTATKQVLRNKKKWLQKCADANVSIHSRRPIFTTICSHEKIGLRWIHGVGFPLEDEVTTMLSFCTMLAHPTALLFWWIYLQDFPSFRSHSTNLN